MLEFSDFDIMKSAHQARLESLNYIKHASNQHTQECIRDIEFSIDLAIKRGHHEVPVNMYTKESLDFFTDIGYTFVTTGEIVWICW